MDEEITVKAIHGHVGSEPKLTTTASGVPRLGFSLGVPRRVRDIEGNWANSDPHYVYVAMYGKSAQRTHAAIRKGDQVLTLGYMREYEVTDSERGPRVMTEFRASRVGHDLNLTTVEVQRRTPTASTQVNAGQEQVSGFTEPGLSKQELEGLINPPPVPAPPAPNPPGPAAGSTTTWAQAAHRVGVTPPPSSPPPTGMAM